MKTPEQWQRELRGETSLQAIQAIQNDARRQGMRDVLIHCENTTATGIQGMCAINNIERWIRGQLRKL